MTAGGDDNVSVILPQHTLVLVFDDGGTDCGFLHIVEAECLKRAAHRLNAHAVIVCDEGGGKADDDGVARLQKNSYLLGGVCNLLCILRALYHTVTAKDTLVTYNMCLVTRKADCLYGTFSYTAEAGFAICFFKCQAACHIR